MLTHQQNNLCLRLFNLNAVSKRTFHSITRFILILLLAIFNYVSFENRTNISLFNPDNHIGMVVDQLQRQHIVTFRIYDGFSNTWWMEMFYEKL